MVDWDHPVFTGGRPVNLQLGGFKNQCLAIDTQQHISAKECNEYDNQQAFIYNRDGHYISAYNTEYCLDSTDLTQAQSCSLSLTQKWSWEEEANQDRLKSAHLDHYLTHDKQTGELSMTVGTESKSSLSTKMYTRYVNVFDPSTVETNSYK